MRDDDPCDGLYGLLRSLEWVGDIDLSWPGALAVLTGFEGATAVRQYELQRYLDNEVGREYIVRRDNLEPALYVTLA